MRESKVESYLKKHANRLGFLCYKFTSPGTRGVPDRILIGHGMVFFVETKAPDKVPRKSQEYRFKLMRLHGATVYVADTCDKVDEVLKEIQCLVKKKNGI